MADDEEVKEPTQEVVHPIIALLGGGVASIIAYLNEKYPQEEEYNFQEFMDALFNGVGEATQKLGTGLVVLSPEDQKILGVIHQIKRQYGPGTKLQIVVKPKGEGIVGSDGNPISSNNKDAPLIIKP